MAVELLIAEDAEAESAESPAFDLGTNSDWARVLLWSDRIDAENFPTLAHLCDYGHTGDLKLSDLAAECRKAAEDDETPPDIAATLARIAELCDGTPEGAVAVVSGGEG